MKEININGFRETIIERSDYPPERCKDILDPRGKQQPFWAMAHRVVGRV